LWVLAVLLVLVAKRGAAAVIAGFFLVQLLMETPCLLLALDRLAIEAVRLEWVVAAQQEKTERELMVLAAHKAQVEQLAAQIRELLARLCKVAQVH
jgi:uncharacterized coiled-coil protein SlyX